MRSKRKVINLFNDNDIFSVKYVISISTEDTLNELWYFLGNSNYFYDGEIFKYLVDLYNVALSYISKNETAFFEIILEESESYLYFTVWSKKASLLFKSYSKKRALNFLYHKKRLTIKLLKSSSETKSINYDYSPIISVELQELQDLSENIQEVMSQILKLRFNNNLYISLKSNLSMFSLSLQNYNNSKEIRTFVVNFIDLLIFNKEKFIKFKKNELKIIDSFIKNIDYYFYKIFLKDETDIDLIKELIKVDYERILTLISSTK